MEKTESTISSWAQSAVDINLSLQMPPKALTSGRRSNWRKGQRFVISFSGYSVCAHVTISMAPCHPIFHRDTKAEAQTGTPRLGTGEWHCQLASATIVEQRPKNTFANWPSGRRFTATTTKIIGTAIATSSRYVCSNDYHPLKFKFKFA